MAKQDRILIGIDGGGTKTHLVMASADGQILGEERVGQSNIHTTSAASIKTQLRNGIERLFHGARIMTGRRVDVIVAGMAGIDHATDIEYAETLVSQAVSGMTGPATQVHVVNDTIIGLYAGVPSGIGICVIGGTGSNCYGRSGKAKESWAGGLGHILADEGSGYDMGLRALMAVVKAEDGRGPATKLSALILKRYGVKKVRDLVPIVYKPDYGKTQIAQIAIDVQEAAEAGDKVAREIAKGAGAELSALVLAVGKKLFAPTKSVDIVLIGGVLQHDPFVQKEFKRLVRAKYKKANFIIPQDPPVMGAIRMAQHMVS